MNDTPGTGQLLVNAHPLQVGLLTRLNAAIPTVPHYTGLVPIQRGDAVIEVFQSTQKRGWLSWLAFCVDDRSDAAHGAGFLFIQEGRTCLISG